MKYWEIIIDNFCKADWSWGCVAAVDSYGGTIFVANAHRGDGKGFIVRSDEKLTAFLELESAIPVSELDAWRNARAESRLELQDHVRIGCKTKSLGEFWRMKSGMLPYRQRLNA